MTTIETLRSIYHEAIGQLQHATLNNNVEDAHLWIGVASQVARQLDFFGAAPSNLENNQD